MVAHVAPAEGRREGAPRVSGQALPRSGSEGGLQKPSSASTCGRVLHLEDRQSTSLRQALAVLAHSCDSTGALKPRRRGRLCGACNRTTGLARACPHVGGTPTPGPQRGPQGFLDRHALLLDSPSLAAVSSWGRSYQLFGHHCTVIATRPSWPWLLAAGPSRHVLSLLFPAPKDQVDLQPRQIVIALGLLASRSSDVGFQEFIQMWVAATFESHSRRGWDISLTGH